MIFSSTNNELVGVVALFDYTQINPQVAAIRGQKPFPDTKSRPEGYVPGG
jgi:hypothetical protein